MKFVWSSFERELPHRQHHGFPENDPESRIEGHVRELVDLFNHRGAFVTTAELYDMQSHEVERSSLGEWVLESAWRRLMVLAVHARDRHSSNRVGDLRWLPAGGCTSSLCCWIVPRLRCTTGGAVARTVGRFLRRPRTPVDAQR